MKNNQPIFMKKIPHLIGNLAKGKIKFLWALFCIHPVTTFFWRVESREAEDPEFSNIIIERSVRSDYHIFRKQFRNGLNLKKQSYPSIMYFNLWNFLKRIFREVNKNLCTKIFITALFFVHKITKYIQIKRGFK